MIPDFFQSPDSATHIGLWKTIIGFTIVTVLATPKDDSKESLIHASRPSCHYTNFSSWGTGTIITN